MEIPGLQRGQDRHCRVRDRISYLERCRNTALCTEKDLQVYQIPHDWGKLRRHGMSSR